MANEKDRSVDETTTPGSQGSGTPTAAEKAAASAVKKESSRTSGNTDRASNSDVENTKSAMVDTGAQPDATDDDNPFDFGGLPNRNLKKNLGCG